MFIGSRANYSSARSIMKAIQATPELKLQVILGAVALLPRFGNLEEILERDGFKVDAKFYMIVEGETPVTMSKSAGLGIIDLTMIFYNLAPDMIVAVGDRFDVMAPVLAATYMNIPIAHTMGGERSGTVDENIRHAITKLSHLHFPANEDARDRIIKMGEDPSKVFNVGCPRMDYVLECLDQMKKEVAYDYSDFFAKHGGVGGCFDLSKEKFLLVSQHPVTTEYGSNRQYIEEILHALNKFKMPTIMIWPNADAGSFEISRGVRVFRETYRPEWLHLFINLPIEAYLRLMRLCSCMIGNSSSAIREGEVIGVPAVNIGTRQNMRLKGKNVVDVASSRDEIYQAIVRQMESGFYETEYLYGNGSAGKKIAKIISETNITTTQKINFY
ncbi:MAG: UDP-N-acetylglucosamine 2-epimerase (hydrolyzing) [Deltaproteobacteria bacterium]|nr:UDP-N-acetylglucosamine 2-epimerase (hydrolyzing) [Deltaproteobacteria bacterium]